MLPAFATKEELDLRLPNGLDTDDEERADAVLEDASTVVRVEAGKSWVDGSNALLSDIPDIVKVCTLKLAVRTFLNPGGATQQGVDQFQVTWGAGDDYWREQLKNAAGRSGLSSIKVHAPVPFQLPPDPLFSWWDGDEWVSWLDESL